MSDLKPCPSCGCPNCRDVPAKGASFDDFRAEVLYLYYSAMRQDDDEDDMEWPPTEDRRAYFRAYVKSDSPLERAIADLWEQAHTSFLFDSISPKELRLPAANIPREPTIVSIGMPAPDFPLAELARFANAIANPEPEPVSETVDFVNRNV